MILSDSDIAQELAYGELDISPVNLEEQLQPCSLDIRLGNQFSEYVTSHNVIFDAKHSDMENYLQQEFVNREEGILIHPDDFYLANTVETLNIPDYLGVELKGRSSYGRMGLEIHSTAGWVDAGFYDSDLVLEISSNVNNSIRIYPGERIGQLIFYQLKSPANEPYSEKEGSKYNGQRGAVGSRVWEEFHD